LRRAEPSLQTAPFQISHTAYVTSVSLVTVRCAFQHVRLHYVTLQKDTYVFEYHLIYSSLDSGGIRATNNQNKSGLKRNDRIDAEVHMQQRVIQSLFINFFSKNRHNTINEICL
jgi:hypothetical protein